MPATAQSSSVMTLKQTRRSTAYHEAGHAVIGRVLGLTCGGATIVPDYDEGSAGHAVTYVERSIENWHCRGRLRWVSMFRARILMLAAGRESEIECLGTSDNGVFGDADDLREISITLPEVLAEGDVPEEVLARLRVKARGLVRRHRRAIAKVAAALMRHSTLDAQQIDAIVVASGVRLVGRIDPATVSTEEKIARAHAWATNTEPRWHTSRHSGAA